MSRTLIEVKDISKSFGEKNKKVPVLRGLTFNIKADEILCVVGESGCGKTTLGKVLAGLEGYNGGSYLHEKKEVNKLSKKDFKLFRRRVQMIHQDPFASLNPTQNVFTILSAPLYRHKIVKGYQQAVDKVNSLLDLVGLTPVQDFIDKFPHQLSGGQRQRISIARSLTLEPAFLIVDEAVSMIDTSLRISILNNLLEIQNKLKVAYFFITHDLAVANYFAQKGRIAVMYLGKIVEIAPTEEIIGNPRHPYTRALIGAIPEADPEVTRQKERFKLKDSEVPSLQNIPGGCAFHTRCPWAEKPICYEKEVRLTGSGQHKTACHLV